MLVSSDKLFNIEVVDSPAGYVIRQADWSWFRIPADASSAEALAKQLSSGSSDRHTLLLTANDQVHCEKRQKDIVLHSCANAKLFLNDSFAFYEFITISYEGTVKRNCTRLTTVSEPGYLFSKGGVPHFKSTSWFNTNYKNGTNHWDVTQHEFHTRCKEPQTTRWGGFAWEVGILMTGLAVPLQLHTFLYEGNPHDLSLISFIKTTHMRCYCYTADADAATKAMQLYEAHSSGGEHVSLGR